MPDSKFNSTNKINIIFFGTSDLAEVILDKLLKISNCKYKIANIITQPDKPVGRKRILTPSPVKLLAEKNKIPVRQPEKLNQEFSDKFKELKP